MQKGLRMSAKLYSAVAVFVAAVPLVGGRVIGKVRATAIGDTNGDNWGRVVPKATVTTTMRC